MIQYIDQLFIQLRSYIEIHNIHYDVVCEGKAPNVRNAEREVNYFILTKLSLINMKTTLFNYKV